jgi:hypothetical protein
MLRTARCAPVKGMKAVEAIGMAAKREEAPDLPWSSHLHFLDLLWSCAMRH